MTTNTNAALRSAAESALEALEILNGIDTETESVTIHVSDEIAALRAALTAAAQPPEGWVMVPMEPTDAMVQASLHLDLSYMPGQDGVDRAAVYRAMLAADPKAEPVPAVQQGDELPREDFAWLVVQEACETEPADEDDPECIRILRRDLKSAVLSAFLRHDAAHPSPPKGMAGWKHDCAALLMNDVELWIQSCPHCGKPRDTAPPTSAEGVEHG